MERISNNNNMKSAGRYWFDYIRTLPYNSNAKPYPSVPEKLHYTTRTYYSSYQVNASGNLYYEIMPDCLAQTDPSTDISIAGNGIPGLIVLNNVAYTNVDLAPTIVTDTGLTDPNIVSILLSGTQFHNVTCVGAVLEFCVSGQSALNRTGVMNVLLPCDDQFVSLTHGGTNGHNAINAYMATRQRNTAMNGIRSKTINLTDSSSNYTVFWLPNFAGASIEQYTSDIGVQASYASVQDTKTRNKVAIYIDGAANTAKLTVKLQLVLAARPLNSTANAFPMEISRVNGQCTDYFNRLNAGNLICPGNNGLFDSKAIGVDEYGRFGEPRKKGRFQTKVRTKLLPGQKPANKLYSFPMKSVEGAPRKFNLKRN